MTIISINWSRFVFPEEVYLRLVLWLNDQVIELSTIEFLFRFPMMPFLSSYFSQPALRLKVK